MWGKRFRAYDKATGQVIWETELPAGTTGGPMTYSPTESNTSSSPSVEGTSPPNGWRWGCHDVASGLY